MGINNYERLAVENIRALTASYTLTINDYLVTCTHSIAVTLPNPLTAQGMQYIIKKTSSTAGHVTVIGTIDSTANAIIANTDDAISLISNGSQYLTAPTLLARYG